MRSAHRFGVPVVVAAVGVAAGVLAAGVARAQCGCQSAGPSAAQMRMMQEYQAEMLRYQKEVAEKQQEIVKQFDEDGNGVLRGPERSKFNKYTYDVRQGKKPNPFASIRPIGQAAASPAP